jgi:hypothetical protein
MGEEEERGAAQVLEVAGSSLGRGLLNLMCLRVRPVWRNSKSKAASVKFGGGVAPSLAAERTSLRAGERRVS